MPSSIRRAALLAALVLPAAPLSAQEAVPLEVDETLSGSVSPGDTARYSLDAGTGFLVRGAVEQVGADVAVRIVDPGGSQAARFDGRRRGAEPFQLETDEAGVYELQVIPDGDEEGDYTVSLERLEPLSTDPEELAEQLLSAYDGPNSPGAAIQVWRDGETLYSHAWGMASLAYGVPFETDTRTNIGSTSKQFTAFAVQLLAERGELSLDDPVRTHVPELPPFDDTVRVRHLLTHTTGYREFLNLLVMEGRRLDRGDHIGRDEILRVVQHQPALQNAPGAEWNYNNTAFALASMIVERVSGTSFPDFMDENVFGPLGMDRTLVRRDPQAIVEDRSVGYAPAPEGGFQELRDLGAAMGAGAIYSTVEDLQTWAENYREPRVGSRALVDEMMTSFVTTGGDTTGYGLGLFVDEQRGLRRVHHGGSDVAHRSMLAYYPEIGAGITVQSNHAGFDSGVAFRLAGAFFGDAMEPEEGAVAEAGGAAAGEAFDPASYDPASFEPYTGRYALESDPAVVVTLSREGDRLLTQVSGQGELTLTPLSDTTFAVEGVEASFVVHTDEDGRGESLTLRQGGMEQRADRIDAEAWEPSPEDLEPFTGRYFSPEIETFYRVAMEEGDGGEEGEPGLVLKHRRLDDMSLTPGEEDAFSASGGLQLSFERDRNGQVVAFYLGNGRTRDVRFERVR